MDAFSHMSQTIEGFFETATADDIGMTAVKDFDDDPDDDVPPLPPSYFDLV